MTPDQAVAAGVLTTSAAGAVVTKGLISADMLHQFTVFFACMGGATMQLVYSKMKASIIKKVFIALGGALMAFYSIELVYEFWPRLSGYDQPVGAFLSFLAFNFLGGLHAISSKFNNSPFAVVDWVRGKGSVSVNDDEVQK